MTETLQANLRRRVWEHLGMKQCPTCGQASGAGTFREGADKVGIKLASFHRFMTGKNADGKTLDAIAAFLERESR